MIIPVVCARARGTVGTPMNGKDKGSSFEREVCRRLSRWISDGKRDDLLWRSASSGGRATFQLRTKGTLATAQAGDVTAIDVAAFPLMSLIMVECKSYKDLQLPSALFKGTGTLWGFWKRTVSDAAAFGKAPVLVAKQNRMPVLAVLSREFRLFRPEIRPVLSSARMSADFYLFDEATAWEKRESITRDIQPAGRAGGSRRVALRQRS